MWCVHVWSITYSVYGTSWSVFSSCSSTYSLRKGLNEHSFVFSLFVLLQFCTLSLLFFSFCFLNTGSHCLQSSFRVSLNLHSLLVSSCQSIEKAGLSARMKGGGGIGVTGGGRGEGQGYTPPSRPYPPGIHPGGKFLLSVLLLF